MRSTNGDSSRAALLAACGGPRLLAFSGAPADGWLGVDGPPVETEGIASFMEASAGAAVYALHAAAEAARGSVRAVSLPHTPPRGSRKWLWKFHPCVRCGRRPDMKLLRDGPQMACWQYAR